jgi:hypothetical protein
MASAATPDKSPPLNPTLRSIVSLLLVLHLFCVAVVLASNFRRSLLQNELVRIFACYTQLLDFDPQFTPYYYTFGRAIDDDAILVLDLYPRGDLPAAEQTLVRTVRLPAGGSNWFGDRRRYFQLASLLAQYADPENENDDITSEIAKSVGARLMHETGNGRVVLRCIRRESQPPPLIPLVAGYPEDAPTDPAYDRLVYEADVWLDEDGVLVQKRAAAAEVAPRQNNPRPATQPPAAGPANPARDAKSPTP